jgi:hypothetical protein
MNYIVTFTHVDEKHIDTKPGSFLIPKSPWKLQESATNQATMLCIAEEDQPTTQALVYQFLEDQVELPIEKKIPIMCEIPAEDLTFTVEEDV